MSALTSNSNVNVKPRLLAGTGDGWAAAHRQALGSNWYLSDVDALADSTGAYHGTEDKLFVSATCLPVHRLDPAQTLGIVALFDRTQDLGTGLCERKAFGSKMLRNIARLIGLAQGVLPKVFLVAGPDDGPWELVELDIWSGQPAGFRAILEAGGSWAATWEAAGLGKLQRELQRRLGYAA